MEKNRKKQIVVLSIALVCIFILVFSLFHKSATKNMVYTKAVYI